MSSEIKGTLFIPKANRGWLDRLIGRVSCGRLPEDQITRLCILCRLSNVVIEKIRESNFCVGDVLRLRDEDGHNFAFTIRDRE